MNTRVSKQSQGLFSLIGLEWRLKKIINILQIKFTLVSYNFLGSEVQKKNQPRPVQ
jgi:hypothetical protein